MPTPIGDSYTDLRAALLARTPMSGPARSRALSRLTDGWLAELAVDSGVTVGGVELVAVGGYGRAELSPYSDLDLVLLHSSETPDDYAAMIAERLWYPIWDSSVRLDHAMRSVGGARQVARVDLADLLGVLDIRHIAGDPELAVTLRRRVLGDWRADADRRLPELLEMCRRRWERSGDLAFATTGDLKNSRGGLRDMVVMRAVAASWVADCPHQGLEEARFDLLAVRDAMHTVTGRATDRLQLQDQDAVAARLGLADRDDLLRMVSAIGRRVGHAVDLTWHRVKRALDGRAVGAAPVGRADRHPLAHDVVEQDGEATLAKSADPAGDPALPLRVAAAAAQAGIPIGPATLARLARLCPPLPERWPATAGAEFLRLLGAGGPLVGVWESMDQVGLISSLLPGWERLRSMPQRDPVHAYTVDRHLVQTVVEAAALVRRVVRPDLLLIAALLHDIGKGTGRDHSVAGAELAGPLCRRFGLAEPDIEVVVTLVRHHLLLAETATRRDPDDPATVALIAEAVGTVGVLDLLQALTEADALAAGPAAWTSWKAQQVATLAARTRAALGGWRSAEPEPQLDPEPQPDPELGPELRAAGTELTVQVHPAADGLTVVVEAPDRVGLLADIAGALTAQRLSIRSATVRTDRGRAVQTWQAEPEFGDPPEPSTVRALLVAALAEPGNPGPVRRRSAAQRPARKDFAAPEVLVIDGASEMATVVEIRAHDAAGLLHTAARAVAATGATVVTALVHTWGAEAVDVLYLRGANGRPLPSQAAERLATLLRAALAADGSAAGPG
ncbi:[protein-PII] uridylyltransferase [Nakamurella lactea]|uniref:[protein-PII] uridylyltransferase n=1 Tax=Nakamurella lactea TaxID=459515 RepID=UPI00041E79E7|nr:[protein-PII] uridylyltransferase [Nakamurella lactea]